MRKLPVYLLIDVSGSMSGEPIESVRTGLSTLVSSLRQNPYALETAYLSIITFHSKAQQIVPLTELATFQQPTIEASGLTALGAALSLLAERVEAEVQKGSAEQKGDWKPLVFLFSDGAATDNLEAGVRAVKAQKFGAFVACAAGSGADVKELQRITETVVSLDTLDSNSVKAFFQWVSASIGVSSQKVDSGVDVNGLGDLPPPPAEIRISLDKD